MNNQGTIASRFHDRSTTVKEILDSFTTGLGTRTHNKFGNFITDKTHKTSRQNHLQDSTDMIIGQEQQDHSQNMTATTTGTEQQDQFTDDSTVHEASRHDKNPEALQDQNIDIQTTAQDNQELLWNEKAIFYLIQGSFKQEFRKIYDMIILLKVGQAIINRDSAYSQVARPTGTGPQAGNILTTAQEKQELLWNVTAEFYLMQGIFHQEFRKIYEMIIQLHVGNKVITNHDSQYSQVTRPAGTGPQASDGGK